MTENVPPKRGGIHPVYGLYIGGSGLDQEYRPTERSTYAFASQRRNVKTISFIERELINARDSTTTLKFDGKLEPVATSTTEIGKERFLTLLERRVEEHGQETFYYMKDIHGTVVNMFDHVHNFTLEAAVLEFNQRNDFENVIFSSFDSYEEDEIKLSRLVVESYLTTEFYEKIGVRYGHRKDFKRLPGSCLLLMALETCNASISHDVDGAATTFAALTLDSYPGEQVSDFSNEALRLIKIMQGGYALPVNTGSRLLQKLTRTSCEEFNRKMFNLMDPVKKMEHKYKVLDPRSIILDQVYHLYGPIALIGELHQIYGQLISDHDWPALATKLPQSNSASAGNHKNFSGSEERKCFRCKGPHLIKDCPLKVAESKDKSSEPVAKKIKTELPAWKYLEPKDLTKPLVDEDGKKWKFCTKCVCRKSGKTGLYLLSHFDSEHDTAYTAPSSTEGNLASVDVPIGIPEVTTLEPGPESVDDDDDPIEFRGAWCASVSAADAARVFPSPSPVSSVEREIGLGCPEVSDSDDTELFSSYLSECDLARRMEAQQCFVAPVNPSWYHRFMLILFWVTLVCWESLTYLFVNGTPPFFGLPRLARRRLARLEWKQRRLRGRRLPRLLFLPTAWMLLTNVILLPPRSSHLPSFRDITRDVYRFGMNALQRVSSLDDMVMLDWDTWLQLNTMKATYLATEWELFASTRSLEESSILCADEERTDDDESMFVTSLEYDQDGDDDNSHFGDDDSFVTADSDGDDDVTITVMFPDPESDSDTEGDDYPSTDSETSDDDDDDNNEHFVSASAFVVERVHSATDDEVDCCVITGSTPWELELHSANCLLLRNKCEANGPLPINDKSSKEAQPSVVAEAYGLLGFFDAPCAFMHFSRSTDNKAPVIFDTGASLAITHEISDFDGPLTKPTGDLRLGGMANGLRIEGVGPVTWTFDNGPNESISVQSMAYYVPKAKARLLSPQRLFDASTGTRGRYEGDQSSFRLYLDGSSPLTIEYDDRNSLPIGYATIGSVSSRLTDPQINLSLVDENNQNLTAGQKLLLHWHHRFGHLNFPAVQRILRAVPFLTAKFSSASKCDLPSMKCSICEYAKGHRRAKQAATSVPNDHRLGALKVEHLKPGAQVSVDHFESRLLGRTFDSYGKASSATYKGGCIFVDHCSGFLHVEHQLGFSAVETIRAKQVYEQMALHHGVIVESYLTDSGAFKANAFVQHVRSHEQRIRYCGANAHHKNGVAERAVQSVSNMARALILHSSAHWKDGIDSSLWPMAVTYATHLYNHLPNAQGLCPADIFTGSTVPRHRLKDIHVWGCPVYVLDPHLQAGQKLPRWQPRSRRGVFMGFSHLHSSEVPLVLNLDTGSITPQYHVVFDDQFSTVSSVERESDPPDNWAELCLENTTFIPTDLGTDSSPSGSLGSDWMTSDDQEWAARATRRQDVIRDTFLDSTVTTTVPTSLPTTKQSSTLSATSTTTMPQSAATSTIDSSLPTLVDKPPPPLLSRDSIAVPASSFRQDNEGSISTTSIYR